MKLRSNIIVGVHLYDHIHILYFYHIKSINDLISIKNSYINEELYIAYNKHLYIVKTNGLNFLQIYEKIKRKYKKLLHETKR